jgi:hypothetical protein
MPQYAFRTRHTSFQIPSTQIKHVTKNHKTEKKKGAQKNNSSILHLSLFSSIPFALKENSVGKISL